MRLPATIADTVRHVETLSRPGSSALQLARATNDAAIIEIGGPFNLQTTTLAASLR
jgi:hypothetical protein